VRSETERARGAGEKTCIEVVRKNQGKKKGAWQKKGGWGKEGQKLGNTFSLEQEEGEKRTREVPGLEQ